MTLYRRFLSSFILIILSVSCLAGALADAAGYDMSRPQDLLPEQLFAESALLVDEDSGEVLFSKNSRVRMFPASTTKIMTLLLALESDIALDDEVTIPAEAAEIPEGSSVIPVKPGDVMRFSDLLYGFMLSSGNDGANAIAVLVDGSIGAFVERMNRRAAEIGCEGTHYVNAHGYHDAEHYTTAQDLALIARTAMENEDFRKIVAAPKWTMSILRDGSETSLDIVSRNSLLQSGEKYYYPECTGIKTGHHNKAGWCFVGSAERDGMRVICVVLNCAEEMSKWYDAARLFEYGFTRYEPVTLSALLERSGNQFASVRVENAGEDDPQGAELLLNLTDVQGGGQTLRVVSGSEASINAVAGRVARGVRVEWLRDLEAPVAEGEQLGRLTLELDGLEPVTAGLTASRSVERRQEATPVPKAKPKETARTEQDTASAAPPEGGHLSPVVWLLTALVVLGLIAAALLARQARLKREREAERRRRRRQAQRRKSGSKRPAQSARDTKQNGQTNRSDAVQSRKKMV